MLTIFLRVILFLQLKIKMFRFISEEHHLINNFLAEWIFYSFNFEKSTLFAFLTQIHICLISGKNLHYPQKIEYTMCE